MSLKSVYNAFKGKVGLRGFSPVSTTYYVDDLPGISFKSFELLTDVERSTFQEVFETVEKEAIGNLRDSITDTMSEKFNLTSEIISLKTGEFDTSNTSGTDWERRGYLLTNKSDNAEIVLEKIDIHNDSFSTSTNSIEVFDASTGELLHQVDISIEAKKSKEVFLGVSFQQEKIFVCYNASNTNSYKLDASKKGTSEYCFNTTISPLLKVEYKKLSNDYSLISEIADEVYEDIGMILHARAQCSFDPFILKVMDRLIRPLRYFIALELLIRISHDDRINEVTLTPIEKINGLIEAFSESAENSLSNFLKSVKIKDPVCMECVAPFRVVHQIP